MRLGVIGTRHIKKVGKARFLKLFNFFKENEIIELHYGDCTGWDELAWSIAAQFGVVCVSHPPIDLRYKAATNPDICLPSKEYLERNKDIVESSDFLIAAPDGPEKQRSGTWSTIRYAKKIGVRGVVWKPQ